MDLPNDWWPQLLAEFPREQPWAGPAVVLAEVRTLDDGPRPGDRHLSAALVPMAQLDAAKGSLREFGFKVDVDCPQPGAGQADGFRPEFWVYAGGLPERRAEALVLSWENTNRVVFTPSPRLLVTYGLIPRLVGPNEQAYDDLRTPIHDVVRVVSPAIWDFPTYSPASVTAQRDYIQDYLSLRGMALVQGYYLRRFGKSDPELDALLGGKNGVELKFADRLIDIRRCEDGDGSDVLVQVWGGRLVAEPGPLPVTVDNLEDHGLVWPGLDEPVTRASAKKLMREWAFVSDGVLEAYEGREGFDVHPDTGSVSWQGQWSVSFCRRVARDTIKLEIRKLYEGAPDAVVRHWHRYAVDPPGGRGQDGREPNIATRSHSLVRALLDLGDQLALLGERLGLTDLKADAFTGLDREWLDYHGWWSAPQIAPVTRAVPRGMTRDAFLGRCAALDRLIAEGLSVSALRRLCRALGVPDPKTAQRKSLALLDIAVRAAGHIERLAISLPAEAAEAFRAVDAEAEVAQPLVALFALNDLRNLNSHFDKAAMERFQRALERLEIPFGTVAAGYGEALDTAVERTTAELVAAARVVGSALQ